MLNGNGEPRRPAASSGGVRFALRAATAEAHEVLDRRYSAFDLGDAGGYGDFLSAHAPAFFAVEGALEQAGANDLIAGWSDRRRSAALRQDLAAMGLRAPDPLAAPVFATDAAMLGAAYVLEGSRLGGAVLIRQVADGLPTAFLAPGRSADWRAFLAVLEERLRLEPELNEAITTAKAVFALFEQSADTPGASL